jgi:hypothetical protein
VISADYCSACREFNTAPDTRHPLDDMTRRDRDPHRMNSIAHGRNPGHEERTGRMSSGSLVTVIVATLGGTIMGAFATQWVLRRTLQSRLVGLEAAVLASARLRRDTELRQDTMVSATGAMDRLATSRAAPAKGKDIRPARDFGRGAGLLARRRSRLALRASKRGARFRARLPAQSKPVDVLTDDPFGTRVVGGASVRERGTKFVLTGGTDGGHAEPTVSRAYRQGPTRRGVVDGGPTLATLLVNPGNGESSQVELKDDRSSWRVGSSADADILIPDASVGVLIGRNGDVWTAASEGPIHSNVLLDGVTLPTVPMPWLPDRKLRMGAITMTLRGIASPTATLGDLSNETHPGLAGHYAAHANKYALALAQTGRERAEAIAAAVIACFDSRLLDPARGAALATMNMTFALRTRDDRSAYDADPAELFVGVAGFDRAGRLRAAANFPVAVWAVTESGPVRLGQLDEVDSLSPVEVAAIPVDDDALRGRPLLFIAAGPDLSVIGPRIRGLTTLNATTAQLTSAVLGPQGTEAPIAVAAAARAAFPDLS